MKLLGIDQPRVLAPMGFVSGGLLAATGRALRNRISDTWHGRERELKNNLEPERKKYAAAVEQRDFDTAVLFAGEAVDLIDSVLPAREIVRRICG